MDLSSRGLAGRAGRDSIRDESLNFGGANRPSRMRMAEITELL